ncbi:DUF1799 domain-containing protein [Lampropedia aestuarii]|nr:DUF1799 domain-containing protein [Lampropedia aestuarii]
MSNPANLAMLSALGIKPEDYQDHDVLAVWPENSDAVEFFLEYCTTQWRIGMAGATGLDYTAVIAALQFVQANKEMFEQVRCIERGALNAMAQKRRDEQSRH